MKITLIVPLLFVAGCASAPSHLPEAARGYAVEANSSLENQDRLSEFVRLAELYEPYKTVNDKNEAYTKKGKAPTGQGYLILNL